jgi:small multidrug resistance family-3 protein
MIKYLIIFAYLVAATTFEAFGDATVRIGLFNRTGFAQVAVLVGGGLLLFGYGTMLNLAPLPFERVVGMYIATLFCVWQIVTFLAFRTLPSPPILIGGALIIAGGLVVTFWQGTGAK